MVERRQSGAKNGAKKQRIERLRGGDLSDESETERAKKKKLKEQTFEELMRAFVNRFRVFCLIRRLPMNRFMISHLASIILGYSTLRLRLRCVRFLSIDMFVCSALVAPLMKSSARDFRRTDKRRQFEVGRRRRASASSRLRRSSRLL